jgi:hypothetical protein
MVTTKAERCRSQLMKMGEDHAWCPLQVSPRKPSAN